MLESNSKTLASVYTHPAVLAVTAALLFTTFASATLVARVAWHIVFAYAVLVALDLVLTKYHLWTFTPTTPQLQHYALITGGSTGIGREMAFQLAARGYSLVLVARTQSALEKTQREILALHETVDVRILAADLSTTAGIQSVIDYAADKALVVDILINNAFVTRQTRMTDLTPEQLDAMLTLNVAAMAKLSHFFAGQMATRGVGRILNVASSAACVITPMHALYSSTKAFMLNVSQAMNYELRGAGVTVTCFCPGPVATNFCDSMKFSCFSVGAVDAKTCATRGLASMFSAETFCHDTVMSYVLGVVARIVLPSRLRAYAGAVMMNEPTKALELLRR